MPRYELEFEAGLDEENPGGIISVGQIKRVVFAGDKETAEQMRETMLWEPVAQSEYLYKLTGIRKVPDSVEYKPFWDIGSPRWANMLLRMGLRPSDVDYVFEENTEKVFIVGFRLKKRKPKPRDKR